MALFRTTVTVAAGTTNNNVMNGSKFEFLGRPSVVRTWASQDGAGAPGAEIDWTLGNVVVGEDMKPNTAATAGNITRDQDGIGEAVGDAGDRIQMRVQNTDAANPVNVNFLIEIAELG